MKILVLKGSPHKAGSSNLLADEFIRGAMETGHQVDIFDAAHAKLHPCMGCDACGMSGPCCQKDDGIVMREKLLGADMVVLVTPLYYFGMSAQLKMAVDRFYSFNGKLMAKRLRAAFIVAAWNEDDWTMDAAVSHYRTLCRYLGFRDEGMVLGVGCGTVSMTRGTVFPKQAYEFGKRIMD